MGRRTLKQALILVFTVVISLAAGPSLADDLEKKVDSGKVASVTGPDIDLGDVNIEGGLVKRTFELHNGNSTDLVLKGAFTSCACTKTFIEMPDGTLSKPFGMSIPRNWYRVIKPGERFKVHVQFDPAYHGIKGVGPFRRNVYLVTSATADDNLSSRLPLIRYGTVSTLTLSGKVLSAADYVSRYPKQNFSEVLGDFRFPLKEHDFGVVRQSGGSVQFDLPFRYEGKDPVTISGTPTSCACASASISRNKFEPGDSGVLTIRFDPNYHEEPEGRFFKDVLILTDPPQKENVQFRIWAEVDLDLGPEAYKFKEHKDDDDEHGEGG
jgi:hypothetical protein